MGKKCAMELEMLAGVWSCKQQRYRQQSVLSATHGRITRDDRDPPLLGPSNGKSNDNPVCVCVSKSTTKKNAFDLRSRCVATRRRWPLKIASKILQIERVPGIFRPTHTIQKTKIKKNAISLASM
jgi:hypothetical protein